jgi:hypothetical protein
MVNDTYASTSRGVFRNILHPSLTIKGILSKLKERLEPFSEYTIGKEKAHVIMASMAAYWDRYYVNCNRLAFNTSHPPKP